MPKERLYVQFMIAERFLKFQSLNSSESSPQRSTRATISQCSVRERPEICVIVFRQSRFITGMSLWCAVILGEDHEPNIYVEAALSDLQALFSEVFFLLHWWEKSESPTKNRLSKMFQWINEDCFHFCKCLVCHWQRRQSIFCRDRGSLPEWIINRITDEHIETEGQAVCTIKLYCNNLSLPM